MWTWKKFTPHLRDSTWNKVNWCKKIPHGNKWIVYKSHMNLDESGTKLQGKHEWIMYKYDMCGISCDVSINHFVNFTWMIKNVHTSAISAQVMFLLYLHWIPLFWIAFDISQWDCRHLAYAIRCLCKQSFTPSVTLQGCVSCQWNVSNER